MFKKILIVVIVVAGVLFFIFRQKEEPIVPGISPILEIPDSVDEI